MCVCSNLAGQCRVCAVYVCLHRLRSLQLRIYPFIPLYVLCRLPCCRFHSSACEWVGKQTAFLGHVQECAFAAGEIQNCFCLLTKCTALTSALDIYSLE